MSLRLLYLIFLRLLNLLLLLARSSASKDVELLGSVVAWVHGLPTGRLLVSSFLIMDPTLAMRTGLVPYWALFGTRPSLDRLAGYLSRTAYDDIRLTVFPHGEDSIGLPGIGEW